jgi:uncharacterized protein Usg
VAVHANTLAEGDLDLSADMRESDFAQMLSGFSLTTAEILYRIPDHPALLQSYVWQEYDLAPRFPKLKAFLDFWSAKLDGKLFKVTVSSARLIKPAELRLAAAELKIH